MTESTQLTDDHSISDDEWLYRGLLKYYVVESQHRISSGAFKEEPMEDLSVDRARLTTPRESLERLPISVALAQIMAGAVRKHTPGVRSDPEIENPAHALILWNRSEGKGAWKAAAKKLADECDWDRLIRRSDVTRERR